MKTRDILLAVVIVAVGLAIVYRLDPTMGGLLKKNSFEMMSDMPEQNNETEENMNRRAAMGATGGEDPTMPEMFTNHPGANGTMPNASGEDQAVAAYAAANAVGASAAFGGASKPTNCYPKDQLTPQELLPNDPNTQWAKVNPQGQGDIAGKNFLSAGSLIGINTVGQSLRNANHQLRSDPPNPQMKVSIWNTSTIEPDINRRPLEIN